MNQLRILTFAGTLLFQIVISYWALLYPVWDQNEGNYVASLLSKAPGYPEQNGAYLLPDNAVLVVGKLDYAVPPPGYEKFRGDNCVAVGMRTEIYSQRRRGPNWRTYSNDLQFATGPHIGSWQIDRRFFENPYLKMDTYVSDSQDTEITCPTERRCRITYSCFARQQISVIGIEQGVPGVNQKVALPHETLLDYPLLQMGALTPPEFIVAYKEGMTTRLASGPIFLCAYLFALNLGLLWLAQGHRDKLLSLSPKFLIIDKSEERAIGMWQKTAIFLLAFGTPVLPFVAYYLMQRPDLFELVAAAFVFGSLWLYYLLIMVLQVSLKEPASTAAI